MLSTIKIFNLFADIFSHAEFYIKHMFKFIL